MLEVPVTLAVKSCVPALGTEALAGLMLNKTAEPPVVVEAGAAVIATTAVAELAVSYALSAVIVTEGAAVADSGAV